MWLSLLPLIILKKTISYLLEPQFTKYLVVFLLINPMAMAGGNCQSCNQNPCQCFEIAKKGFASIEGCILDFDFDKNPKAYELIFSRALSVCLPKMYYCGANQIVPLVEAGSVRFNSPPVHSYYILQSLSGRDSSEEASCLHEGASRNISSLNLSHMTEDRQRSIIWMCIIDLLTNSPEKAFYNKDESIFTVSVLKKLYEETDLLPSILKEKIPDKHLQVIQKTTIGIWLIRLQSFESSKVNLLVEQAISSIEKTEANSLITMLLRYLQLIANISHTPEHLITTPQISPFLDLARQGYIPALFHAIRLLNGGPDSQLNPAKILDTCSIDMIQVRAQIKELLETSLSYVPLKRKPEVKCLLKLFDPKPEIMLQTKGSSSQMLKSCVTITAEDFDDDQLRPKKAQALASELEYYHWAFNRCYSCPTEDIPAKAPVVPTDSASKASFVLDSRLYNRSLMSDLENTLAHDCCKKLETYTIGVYYSTLHVESSIKHVKSSLSQLYELNVSPDDLEKITYKLVHLIHPVTYVSRSYPDLKITSEDTTKTMRCMDSSLLSQASPDEHGIIKILLKMHEKKLDECFDAQTYWNFSLLSLLFSPPDLRYLRRIFFCPSKDKKVIPTELHFFFQVLDINHIPIYKLLTEALKAALLGANEKFSNYERLIEIPLKKMENIQQNHKEHPLHCVYMVIRFIQAAMQCAYSLDPLPSKQSPRTILEPLMVVAEAGYLPALTIVKQMLQKNAEIFSPEVLDQTGSKTKKFKQRIEWMSDYRKDDPPQSFKVKKSFKTSEKIKKSDIDHDKEKARADKIGRRLEKMEKIEYESWSIGRLLNDWNACQSAQNEKNKVIRSTLICREKEVCGLFLDILKKDESGVVINEFQKKQLKKIQQLIRPESVVHKQWEYGRILSFGAYSIPDKIYLITRYLTKNLNPGNLIKGARCCEEMFEHTGFTDALTTALSDHPEMSSGLFMAVSQMKSTANKTIVLAILKPDTDRDKQCLCMAVAHLSDWITADQACRQNSACMAATVFLASEIYSAQPEEILPHISHESFICWIDFCLTSKLSGIGKSTRKGLMKIKQHAEQHAERQKTDGLLKEGSHDNADVVQHPLTECQLPTPIRKTTKNTTLKQPDSSVCAEKPEIDAPLSATCAICFLPYSEGKRKGRIYIDCGHTFCTLCIQKNINEKRYTCPICKVEMKTKITKAEELPVNYAIMHTIEEITIPKTKVENADN